jgi:hypothetical protein
MPRNAVTDGPEGRTAGQAYEDLCARLGQQRRQDPLHLGLYLPAQISVGTNPGRRPRGRGAQGELRPVLAPRADSAGEPGRLGQAQYPV